MSIPWIRRVWAVGGGVMFVFATALLLATFHSTVQAQDEPASEWCWAVVGGDHCCACGDDGNGEVFCTEIQANAKAVCATGVFCEGFCYGSIE